MRQILRPFLALMVMVTSSAGALAQDQSPSLRAHQQNRKHHAQQDRLEAAERYEDALLKPYQPRSPLIKRTRKGTRPVRIVEHLNKPEGELYLDLRTSKHSTRERVEADGE